MFLPVLILSLIVVVAIPIKVAPAIFHPIYEFALVVSAVFVVYFPFHQFPILEQTFISYSFYFLCENAFTIEFIILKLSFILITIAVNDFTILQVNVELPFFSQIFSISNPLAFSPSVFEPSLIDLILFDFSSMEPFDSLLKLPNIFDSVRLQHSISVDLIVFPLPNVFNPESLLLFPQDEILVIPFMFLWNRGIHILGQGKRVVKVIVFQFFPLPFLNWGFIFVFVPYFNLFIVHIFVGPHRLVKLFPIELPTFQQQTHIIVLLLVALPSH